MHLDPRLLRLARHGRFALLLSMILGFSTGVLAIAQAGLLSRVIDQIYLGRKTLAEVSGLCIILLMLLILRPVLAWGSDLAAHRVARKVKNWLHASLVDQIEAQGPAYTAQEQTGELSYTLSEGVEALDAYYSQYLPGIALALLVPAAILLFVFQIDLLSGLIFLLTAPLIPLFMVLIGSHAQTLTQRQWRTLSRLSAFFLDVIQGLTALKTLGRSQEQVTNIARASEQFRQATMSVLRVTFLSALTLEMAATLSTAVVAVQIGLRLLYGQIAFEPAFTVLVLAPEFYLPLRMLGARFHAGMAGVEAARRLFQVLERPARQVRANLHSDRKAEFAHLIRFEDVVVSYEEGRPALQGVTFEIHKGQRIALIGASGSGKSTIAALLLQFIEPDRGRITVDGSELHDFPREDWRKITSWVPQNPYLFDDTVEQNIRLGRPGASQQEVVRAARLAEAHDFILRLPQGYQTHIGERGARLSGGEAQRIALARAFLREAELVILDEATANLDAESESRLLLGLDRLLKDRTALIIAHRLNTIQKADQILVFDQGRICQSGPPAELANQEGPYRQMMFSSSTSIESWPASTKLDEIEPGRGFAARPVRIPETNLPLSYEMETGGRLPALRRLLRLAASVWDWAALAVLAGTAAILSGVGLMAASAFIISAAALQPSIALLQVPIVGVRFFGIARGLFRYLERYLSHQATFRLLARLRVWFYQALEPLAPARLMRYRSGDLLARILSDIQSLENFYVRALAPPLTAVLALAVVFAFVSRFSIDLGLALLFFWIAAGIGAPLLARWLGKPVGFQLIEQRARLSIRTVDFIQGLADLSAFNQSERAAGQVKGLGEQLTSVGQKMSALTSLQNATTALMGNLGMWSVLVLAVPLVASGQIDGVYLAVLALAALTSFEAVSPLPAAAQHMESNLQSARRLFEVVDEEPEVIDPASPLPLPEMFDLRVRNLSFGYPGGEFVLQGISFDLPPGKRMAVVGASGAGKSTLVNLLLRFWEYRQGEILLNGQDLRKYPQAALRSRISVVPQKVFLFSASLRDNLRIANPAASDEEIVRAANQAGMHNFIQQLPGGYETWAGEQGLLLSGGERQRIAIGRALLKPAPLLILDEGTANLDPLNETKMLQSICSATQGRSLLLITHRLVGMGAMDEILVLEKGQVVERGRHQELLAKRGLYYRLNEQQRLIY